MKTKGKKNRQNQLLFEETQDSRLKQEDVKSFKIPKSIFLVLFVVIIGVFGFNQLVKNGLYGTECVKAAEDTKKSKFSDQLKLLQQNVDNVDEKALKGGELGGTKDFNNIFADPNLFKNFGGFDNKSSN